MDPGADDLLRELAPQAVGVLTRRFGDFSTAEDAVQEALLAAAVQWPAEGTPDNPRGWLIQVASRRMTELVRSEQARRRREDLVARQEPADRRAAPPADHADPADQDDTLTVLFLCCHPALSPASAIALTLRCVGGLTTAEIARAFMVPETTMAQRISRAKQRIRSTGTEFRMPDERDRARRLAAVLHVLYLIFSEGAGPEPGPHRPARGTDPARGTGPEPLGQRGHRRGRRAAHRCPAARNSRPLPGPGRDSRGP